MKHGMKRHQCDHYSQYCQHMSAHARQRPRAGPALAGEGQVAPKSRPRCGLHRGLPGGREKGVSSSQANHGFPLARQRAAGLWTG